MNASLDAWPIINVLKEVIQLVQGHEMGVTEKYKPSDYAIDIVSVLSGGTVKTVKTIGKVVGTSEDIEKKAKNLEKAAKNTKHEMGILGSDSTGRTTANTLEEQLAMKEVKSTRNSSNENTHDMTDSRWPKEDGWVKMAHNVNGVEIQVEWDHVKNQEGLVTIKRT